MSYSYGSESFELLSSPARPHNITTPEIQDGKSRAWKTTSWTRHRSVRSTRGYQHIGNQNSADQVHRLPNGWKAGAFASVTFVGLVLCCNIGVTIWLIIKRPPAPTGVGLLRSGPCTSLLKDSTWIHVAINVCSTILVAASNYNMQCLTAPTRKEIEIAHGNKQKLEIGVHSVRNLRYARPIKVLLWILLLLSTVPLHLLWNSSVFTMTTLNEYGGVVVAPEFLNYTNYGIDCSSETMSLKQQLATKHNGSLDSQQYTTCRLLELANAGELLQISPAECIDMYYQKLTSPAFNLIAVVTNGSATNISHSFPSSGQYPVLAYYDSTRYSDQLSSWCTSRCSDWCTPWSNSTQRGRCAAMATPQWWDSIQTNKSMWCNSTSWDTSLTSYTCYQFATNGSSQSTANGTGIQGPSSWICPTDSILDGSCTLSSASSHSSQWNILPEGYQIDHCLVSSREEDCELLYSSDILYAVILCNVVKFCAILLHVFIAKDDICVTVGDAVAAFLDKPDATTQYDCLQSIPYHGVDYYPIPSDWKGQQFKPRVWRDKRNRRWIHGTNWLNMNMCIIIWTICIVTGGVFLLKSSDAIGSQSIVQAGFGTLNYGALVAASSQKGGSSASIITTSIVVNAPQLIFSSLYFIYNTTFTFMAAAYEWSGFATTRKALRVTSPKGQQRSTYWLSLPWRFSLPLLASSALLHWLISQSMFLVNTRIFSPADNVVTDESIPMISDSGVITAIGFSPLAILLGLSFSTLLFISVFVVSSFRLKPGMVLVKNISTAISATCHNFDDKEAARGQLMWGAVWHQEGDQPGHCCFSRSAVEKPQAGQMYW